MKKYLFFIFAFLITACGAPQQNKPVEEKPVQSVEKKEIKSVIKDKETETQLSENKVFETNIDQNNKKLDKATIEQFRVGSAEIPQKQWENWAKKAAPIVKDLLNMMPNGYALEITGHTDTTGTEEVNSKLSENRALAVYNALLKQGIKSDKIIYKGVSSSSLITSINNTDPKQRRVTFKIIKK